MGAKQLALTQSQQSQSTIPEEWEEAVPSSWPQALRRPCRGSHTVRALDVRTRWCGDRAEAGSQGFGAGGPVCLVCLLTRTP